MQPTISPWAWVSSWDRRARTRAAGEYARSRDLLASRARDHDKFAFYGLRKESEHFVRLEPVAKDTRLVIHRQYPKNSASVTFHVDPYNDPHGPWAPPDVKVQFHEHLQNYRPYEPVSVVLPGGSGVSAGAAGSPRAGPPAAHSWSYGARGWAAGAVVLALLVILVRAAENCLHKKLFKAIYMHTNVGAGELQQDIMPGHYRLHGVRRQESEEWATPSVTATSAQLAHRDVDAGSGARLADIASLTEPSPHSDDMPPPYSECTRSSLNKYASEEPPPPYSACYVAYTNPKGADPQVHIRRPHALDERTQSSANIDNAQNDLIEHGLRAEAGAATPGSIGCEHLDPAMRTEFVFDNGRVVERLSLDRNSNSSEPGVAGDGYVDERRSTHADLKDRVVFLDETESGHATPDLAIRV